jgi:hypothetical protein
MFLSSGSRILKEILLVDIIAMEITLCLVWFFPYAKHSSIDGILDNNWIGNGPFARAKLNVVMFRVPLLMSNVTHLRARGHGKTAAIGVVGIAHPETLAAGISVHTDRRLFD